jgi:hypothetical protein
VALLQASQARVPAVQEGDQVFQAEFALHNEIPHVYTGTIDRLRELGLDEFGFRGADAPGELEVPGHREVARMPGDEE